MATPLLHPITMIILAMTHSVTSTHTLRTGSLDRLDNTLCINSSPPGQNSRRFADVIFGRVFVNEKFCILIRISLKFVLRGPIRNNSALV